MQHGPPSFRVVHYQVFFILWLYHGSLATAAEERSSSVESLLWADYTGLFDGTAGVPLTEPGLLLGQVLANDLPQPQLRHRAGFKKHVPLIAVDIQPETLLTQEKPFNLLTWGLFSSTFMIFGFLCVCFCLSCAASAVTDRVQNHIQTFDPDELGASVSLERLESNALTGRLEAFGLVVGNPPGRGYASEHLLRAAKVSVDLDLVELNLTAFRTINVESLEVSGVDVHFETRGESSNVEDVLTHLRQRGMSSPGSQPRNVCLQRVRIDEIGSMACPPSVQAAKVTVLRAIREEDGNVDKPGDSFVELRYGVQSFRTNTRRSDGRGCIFDQALTPFPLTAGEPLVCSLKRVEQAGYGGDGNFTPTFEEVGETAPMNLESLELTRAPGGSDAWEAEVDLWKAGALTGILSARGSSGGNLRAGRILLRVEMVGMPDHAVPPPRRVSLGDLHFTDFDREIGQSTARGTAAELLKTVLETVLQNLNPKRMRLLGPEPSPFLVPCLHPPFSQPAPQAPLCFLVPSSTEPSLPIAPPPRQVAGPAPSTADFPVIVTSLPTSSHPSPREATQPVATISPFSPTAPPSSPAPSPTPTPLPASPPRTEPGASSDHPRYVLPASAAPVQEATEERVSVALPEKKAESDEVWVEVGVPAEIHQADADKPQAAS